MARLRQIVLLALAAAGLQLAGYAAADDDRRETSVGMPARIDQLVLPGSELEVKPLENRKLPIVVRIVESYRHGTAYRYDLTYYGLDPGTFDLKDYLRRKDGTSTADLPSLPVTIRPLLPPGQVQPHQLELNKTSWWASYRVLLAAGGGLWVLGLAAIILLGRRKKRALSEESDKPLTLADRLRPLVEQAMAGQLDHARCADLERSLLAYWRTRLNLNEASPADAMETMRQHAEAGPLLEQLEIWLHRPGSAHQVDIAALLKPYQNLPADALDVVQESREDT